MRGRLPNHALNTQSEKRPAGYIDNFSIDVTIYPLPAREPKEKDQQGIYVHLLNILYNLLSTLRQLQRHRLTPQPQCYESYPPGDRNRNTRHPGPSTGNCPTARELIVCKVAHGNGVLFFDVGEEGPLVVYFEVEDSMLVGDFERGRPDCRSWGSGGEG